MGKELSEIKACIEKDMQRFEQEYKQCFLSGESLLDKILSYSYSQKGKHIRPIISCLVANVFGKVTEKTIRSSVIIELLHTASLLHDDVIDDSNTRRNQKTVNFIWDNKTAILVGDYIYGKCLSMIKTQDDFNLMPVYATVGEYLPMGELGEKEMSDSLNTKINSYLEVIKQKTAVLIKAAAKIGALTCEEKEVDVENVGDFGESVGMAFQIKDDILDFTLNNESGKGVGNDIKEKKITLPLIYYIDTLNEKDKEEVLSFIEKENKEEKEIKDLIIKVNESKAIKQAEKTLEEYSSRAKHLLTFMPKNIYTETLNDLVQYLIDRKK
jgi:octaprenyl-diphosphate synthase